MDKTEPNARARALCELARRRTRYEFLPSVEFTDYAWDLMLSLYAMQDQNVSVGTACDQTSAPRTTMLRHIDVMERSGLLRRSTDPTDKRRMYLRLTEDATKRVHDYLCSDYPSVT